MVGYGFARFRFPGRDVLFGICLATMMLPFIVTVIPRFVLFRNIGLFDTLTRHPVRKKVYDCATCLNRHHPKWAWCSLVWVAWTDVYIRLCSMGVIHDLRII